MSEIKMTPADQKAEKAVLSQREIYEFLPAAVEIEQTPASPVGRAIIWAILLLFTIGVVWAIFGKIDIVATAQGKVIPSERVKVIQPLETASIAQIHVRDGQFVHAGDPLITLDTTTTEADVRRLTQEWAETAAQKARLEAFGHWFEQQGQGNIDVPVLTTEDPSLQPLLVKQQNLLFQQVAEFNAKLSSLQQETARLEAESQMTRAEIIKNTRMNEVLMERVSAYDIMQSKKLGSRVQYLEIKQDQIEVEQDIAVQQARLKQLEASIAANQAQQQSLRHEQYKTTLLELQQVSTQEASLREEKTKAEQRSKQYHLTAPLDGTVQQLAVHTVGGVVTPAQELMLIVPEQSEMEVEAMVLNKDIGFVQEGQPAEVKIDTFNFTKYGVIDAELIDLSGDAIQDEQLGLVYKARLKLKQDGLTVESKYVRLSPGMSVMAEVKTGQRRIIEFFLAPLLRYKEESLGER
ncbi:HlyD family type I secretion periplasmic adaptor subunit [Hahella ganghwensis]|uniref:HlyD family type I secretion periplasmic adaptor subunit n=1 Tax=Hahella ganghwensis TaxID=286420 RepID=UPI000364F85D|nr:HlyD family type I secretion periplasmic adaptor subunit [Hahella ganghwensis]